MTDPVATGVVLVFVVLASWHFYTALSGLSFALRGGALRLSIRRYS